MSTQAKPTLEVTSRDTSGKGVARKLRAVGSVPAVCYGQDSEPKLLSVSVESVEFIFPPANSQKVATGCRKALTRAEGAKIDSMPIHRPIIAAATSSRWWT